jgi:SnoaL-like protein
MDDDDLYRVVDEQVIRSLHHAYADVVNRRAWDELRDLFIADAPIIVDLRTGEPRRLTGPAALGEFIGNAVQRFDFFELALLSARVLLDDSDRDHATGRMYMNEIRHEHALGRWSMAYGLYQDEYARTSDGWRFAARHYHSMARTGPDLEVFEFPPDVIS